MATVWVFVVTLISTVFCAAVNAYTLQVAYPLWASVGAAEFGGFHSDYLRRLWPVITLPHVVMFFASAALIWRHPGFITERMAVSVFALDAAVIGISAFVAGPVHDRFTRQGRMDVHGLKRLLKVSVFRVVLMLAACGVLIDGFMQGVFHG
jgi:hypothetical protein